MSTALTTVDGCNRRRYVDMSNLKVKEKKKKEEEDRKNKRALIPRSPCYTNILLILKQLCLSLLS